MKIIDKDNFLDYKKSDTVIVYGSGFSINKLDQNDKKILGSYDSIGFNWFCKSGIPVTFYIIREQCVPIKRNIRGETLSDFLTYINSKTYLPSCRIVHKAKYLKQKGIYSHFDNHGKIKGKGIIVNDVKIGVAKARLEKDRIVRHFSHDILTEGSQHGILTMYNVLHVVTYLGYKRVIFAGVDLYDSRYCWLGKNKTRQTVKSKRKTYKSRHVTAMDTLRLVKTYKKIYPDVKMYTYSKKSLLKKYMPVYHA